jgi:hypothetical protein
MKAKIGFIALIFEPFSGEKCGGNDDHRQNFHSSHTVKSIHLSEFDDFTGDRRGDDQNQQRDANTPHRRNDSERDVHTVKPSFFPPEFPQRLPRRLS